MEGIFLFIRCYHLSMVVKIPKGGNKEKCRKLKHQKNHLFFIW